MKRIYCLLLLLTLSLSAQEVDLTSSVLSLKLKIHSSTAGERLMWMDSLARLIEDRTDFEYDSIARSTIEYALELDSTRLVLKHARSLMEYTFLELKNPERSIEIFSGLMDITIR